MSLSSTATPAQKEAAPTSSGVSRFSPTLFLSALGAGGLSVAGFAFINYTLPHGEGLITFAQTHAKNVAAPEGLLYSLVEGLMVLFAAVHFALTFTLFGWMVRWLKAGGHRPLLNDPLRNSALLTPFLSITMSFNVVLSSLRYFLPALSDNFQALMLPGLIGWGLIWAALLLFEIKLIVTAFKQSFDFSKINFSWLMHPFALSMVTVTGTGISALSKDSGVAHTATFMAMISGSVGLLLLVVKLVALFASHFAAPGLPDRQFQIGFLMVVPIVTLYAISFFRVGHYLERNFSGVHLGPAYFMAVTTFAFAFQTWYLLFGLALLRDYFRQHFFREFFINQWGLICPFVAYAVLGSFVYSTFVKAPVLFWGVAAIMIFASLLYFALLYRQFRCWGLVKRGAVVACS